MIIVTSQIESKHDKQVRLFLAQQHMQSCSYFILAKKKEEKNMCDSGFVQTDPNSFFYEQKNAFKNRSKFWDRNLFSLTL
jgi:hypothetical protein